MIPIKYGMIGSDSFSQSECKGTIPFQPLAWTPQHETTINMTAKLIFIDIQEGQSNNALQRLAHVKSLAWCQVAGFGSCNAATTIRRSMPPNIN